MGCSSGMTQSPDRARQSAVTPAKPEIGRRPPVAAAHGNQAHLRRLAVGGRPLQAKLTIGAVKDPLEHEADTAADRVMGMADPEVVRSTGPAALQRKCAACEEEEKPVRRKTAGGDMAGEAAPPEVGQVLSTPGRALDPATHEFMASRFGTDFSDVRIHTDARAARSAEAVGARAYTVGNNVVFGAGQYDPAGEGGRRLLAHELAHVVQQDAAPAVRRFGSEEHIKVGEHTSPGQTIDLGPEVGKVSFGEMIALGDYFESVSQILSEAGDALFGAQVVKVALWKVNPAGRTRPIVGKNVDDMVDQRYFELAAKNQTHFTTGSESGKSNREQYIEKHQRAVGNAYSQGVNRIIQGVSWEGWEGFAQHFLTDAFSAGHVRTPRHEIQAFWNSKFPNFTSNLLDMISCFMAAYINDQDNVGFVKTVGGLASDIRPILVQRGGAALSSFAFGDMISKVLHDSDNMGLEVVSPASASGPGQIAWRAIGDGNLYSQQTDPTMKAAQAQTQQMVEQASRRSFVEAQSAASAGAKLSGNLNDMMNPKNFRALELLPNENIAKAAPILNWKANDILSLDATVRKKLVSLFDAGQEIGDQVRGFKVDCITTRSGFDLHTWEAWVCFRETLLKSVINTLHRIAAGDTCPAGNDNPCGKVTTPCP